MEQTPFVAHCGAGEPNTAQPVRILRQSNNGFFPSIATTTSRTLIFSAFRAKAKPPPVPSLPATSPPRCNLVKIFARYSEETPCNSANSRVLASIDSPGDPTRYNRQCNPYSTALLI